MEASMEVIPANQVADVLLGKQVDIGVLDADVIQQDIVARILAAETQEEAHAAVQTTPAAELEGILVTVHGVAWAKSSFADGPAVYAMLDVTLDGEDNHMTVSMGGRTTMAAFLWDSLNGGFPIRGTFKKERSATNPDRSFWTFVLRV